MILGKTALEGFLPLLLIWIDLLLTNTFLLCQDDHRHKLLCLQLGALKCI